MHRFLPVAVHHPKLYQVTPPDHAPGQRYATPTKSGLRLKKQGHSSPVTLINQKLTVDEGWQILVTAVQTLIAKVSGQRGPSDRLDPSSRLIVKTFSNILAALETEGPSLLTAELL